MNYKSSLNCTVIWSPNCDNRFIKVVSKQIELYEITPNHLDEDLLPDTNIKKIGTYIDNELIKAASWQVSKTDDIYSVQDEIIAIGLMNGVIKFLNLHHISNESDELKTEKELKPKHMKPFLYIIWNPYIRNMLAQVIDKSKGTSANDPSILIWEFQKFGDNKILTPTMNQNNLPVKFISQQSIVSTNSISQSKVFNESITDQPTCEYCRGDVVNSFAWISQSQFICGVNNKNLKIFEIKGQNPLKVVNADATYGLCIDIQQTDIIISSFVDDKIVVWKEDSLDKPILTYIEDSHVESLEWSPLRQGYLCVTYKDKPYIKVLDTKMGLINVLCDIEHVLIDRVIKYSNDFNIVSATWHKQIENCILLLGSDDNFEILYFRTRRIVAWSVEQKFVVTLERNLHFYPQGKEDMCDSCLSANNGEQPSKTKDGIMKTYSTDSGLTNIGLIRNDVWHFLENDISSIMKERAQNGYGLKSQSKEFTYSSMFPNNSELKKFWTWIENASNNCHFGSNEGYINKLKVNPFGGAIDGISDVAKIYVNQNTLEVKIELNENVSKCEEIRWNNMYDSLPFPKYTHPFRAKIFSACGWPFDQVIEKWRPFLESLENKERAAAMALVTLNFDVALQYLKRIPKEKGMDSEILRLCLAGFNTQSGQANNSIWSSICKDVLNQLGNSRPYLRLIFNFLIVKNKNDLRFIESLNILLIDKLAIAALYMDDESLIEFFNNILNSYLKTGDLEMVALTGLKSKEFIYLLQAYVNRTMDIQTVAIAVLQANILTRNQTEKTKESLSWIDCYRNLLDNWRMWFSRADFDISNQYMTFIFNKEPPKIVKPTVSVSKSNLLGFNTISNQNQVYVACGFCGWKISQPSKYTSNMNRNSIQNKTRPDGSLYGTATISSLAMQAGGCKSTICQHCRKPLPRCSVCLMNMGINGDAINISQANFGMYSQKDDQLPSNPIDNWFMWCQKCKHGGHTGHLQKWFLDWNECPVSGCKCTCCDLDSSYSLFSFLGEKLDENSVDLF